MRLAPTYLLSAVVLLQSTGCCPDPDECGTAPPQPPPSNVVAIRIWDGDGQVGPAGTLLTPPLAVRLFEPVTDAARRDNIRFRVVSGGGSLASMGGYQTRFTTADQEALVETLTDGVAAIRLRLGAGPGENRVRAEFPNGSRFVEFTAIGHGPATDVAIDLGNGQSGEVGAELDERVSIKVTDAAGIGIPDMRVWFYPNNGGGPIDGEVTTTSRTGVGRMPSRWRLGPGAGNQTLEARVLQGASGSALANLSGNPARFTATARAPAPASVARNPATFPEPQIGVAGQPAGLKPSVKVAAASGAGIAGVSVRFAVTAGGGTLGGLLVIHEALTDAAGVITVPDWILGNAGTNTVTATVVANGVAGNPVTFTANASAAALGVAITAGNNQSGEINTTYPVKPQVRVTNAAGVGVGGVRINWAVVQGSGSFLPASQDTDSQGFATLDYFGPTSVGAIQLRAATSDTRVVPSSVTFTLTGTPRP